MSVILDALKRVQDENRRRGMDPDAAHYQEAVRDADAMTEGLNTSAPPPRQPPEPEWESQSLPVFDAEPRRLSPVVWVGIITLCSVAVIATALWWFEPDFTGAQANGGRPLLTDLRGNGDAPSRSSTQPEVITAPSANTAMTSGDQARAQDAARTMPTPIGRDVTPGDDLSDLSEALPPESPATQPQVRDQAPAFDLRAGESEPATGGTRETGSQNGGSFSLTSTSASDRTSDPAATEVVEPTDWRRSGDAAGNPFAARESEPDSNPATARTLLDPSVRSGFERGLQLQKAGDLPGAEDAYLRALKRDPNNAQINANLAVLYEAQGRFQLAERHLRQSINVAPDNPSAHNNLGVVLYRMGNYDGALIEFNRALSLDSGQLDAYTNKGLIFMRWGRHADAQRAFSQVLVLDPANALAHYNLGLVYEEMQQWSMAIDSYYRFLDTGGASHPEIVRYVVDRLPWVEARLGAQ